LIALLVLSVLTRAVCVAIAATFAVRDRDAGLGLAATILAGTAVHPVGALIDFAGSGILPDPVDVGLGLAWSTAAVVAVVWVTALRRRRLDRERELRRSESLLRTVTENLSEYLFVADLDGTIVWVNRTVPELTTGSVLGRHAKVFVPPAHRERIETAFARARSEGASSSYRAAFRWFETRIRPVFVDGAVRSILASSREITEHLRLEQTVSRSRRLDALATLATGVAHDFNDVVTAIRGSAELARADLDATDHDSTDRDAACERVRGALDRIESASARASGMTRQLLSVGRHPSGDERIVDVDASIERLADLLRGLLGKSARLDLRLGSGTFHVRIDPSHLEQIVVQLVANARDAIGERGHVTVETTTVELDTEYGAHHPEASPGPKLVLRVSDDGIGMDRETRALVFEPFFTTKAEGSGSGLGLAVVHGLVTLAGGHVELESDPGGGSTFRAFFPAVTEPATEPAPPTPATRAAADTPAEETVLVCEDNVLVREVTAAALRTHGYRVLEAPDAEVALDLCRDHDGPIDLLVTDIVLPGMDGRALAERLTLQRPDAAVLFVSGHGPERAGLEDVRVETLAFLAKPYTPASLLPRVRELLDRS
jgi:PAS domain S-box-containing protein